MPQLFNERRMQQAAIDSLLHHRQLCGHGTSLLSIFPNIQQDLINSCLPVERTLYRWAEHYERYNELPCETQAFYKKLCQQARSEFINCSRLTPETLSHLQDIVTERPELYLDEIVADLYHQTRILFAPSTVWRILTKKLNYRLKVYSQIAAQRSDAQRQAYLRSLNYLVRNKDLVKIAIFCDETHKDRNASRRRRVWAKRNQDARVTRWFDHFFL